MWKMNIKMFCFLYQFIWVYLSSESLEMIKICTTITFDVAVRKGDIAGAMYIQTFVSKL